MAFAGRRLAKLSATVGVASTAVSLKRTKRRPKAGAAGVAGDGAVQRAITRLPPFRSATPENWTESLKSWLGAVPVGVPVTSMLAAPERVKLPAMFCVPGE